MLRTITLPRWSLVSLYYAGLAVLISLVSPYVLALLSFSVMIVVWGWPYSIPFVLLFIALTFCLHHLRIKLWPEKIPHPQPEKKP